MRRFLFNLRSKEGRLKSPLYFTMKPSSQKLLNAVLERVLTGYGDYLKNLLDSGKLDEDQTYVVNLHLAMTIYLLQTIVFSVSPSSEKYHEFANTLPEIGDLPEAIDQNTLRIKAMEAQINAENSN
jgi:hypothetical protein